MSLRFFSFCFKVYYTNWYCHQQSLPYICSKRGPHPQPLSKGRGESSTELSSQELSLRSYLQEFRSSGVQEFRQMLQMQATCLLVYSSTRQLKKMSLFLTNATRKIEKNGGAFDALSHEWRDAGFMFSAC